MAMPIDPGHCPDHLLLTLVHGQPFEGALAARAHVETCPACTQRQRALAAEDALIGDVLGALDHPAAGAGVLHLPAHAPRQKQKHRAGWAAAAAVVLGTAALAALPASPLHQALFAPRREVAATPPTSSLAPADPAPASGIAVPASPVVEIRLLDDQQDGEIVLQRTSQPDVAIRSRGGAIAFDVTEQAIRIDNRVPATTYLVDLPATVRELRLLAGRRTVLRWPADSARLAGTDDTGAIRVPLTPTPEAR